MQNSPLRVLLIAIGVLVLVGAGVYSYVHTKSTSTLGTEASTTVVTLDDGTKVVVPAGSTITEQDTPASQTPKAPDFHAAVIYSASIPADAKSALEAQRQNDIAALSKNAQDYNAWMNLAVINKIAGDYHSAEAIWLYVTKAWPQSPTAFSNLADLYQNFLHDPAKAKLYADLAAKLQ